MLPHFMAHVTLVCALTVLLTMDFLIKLAWIIKKIICPDAKIMIIRIKQNAKHVMIFISDLSLMLVKHKFPTALIIPVRLNAFCV